MSGTSQATFNKLQVPRDISEKALQNPVISAQLLNVQKHSDGDQGDSWHFCVVYIPYFQRYYIRLKH
jgi:hypothetical protein